MAAGTYPCVINETYWFVVVDGNDSLGLTFSTVCLQTTSHAAAQAERERQDCCGSTATIVRHDVVFVGRCSICGEYSGVFGQKELFGDWHEMVDWLSPGWSATSEQQVFCPNHRPDKEE